MDVGQRGSYFLIVGTKEQSGTQNIPGERGSIFTMASPHVLEIKSLNWMPDGPVRSLEFLLLYCPLSDLSHPSPWQYSRNFRLPIFLSSKTCIFSQSKISEIEAHLRSLPRETWHEERRRGDVHMLPGGQRVFACDLWCTGCTGSTTRGWVLRSRSIFVI